MSENEEEKKDDFEQSTALSLRQINANKSIKDIENKCKFDKYDRNKFDTNAKQKTKESQFKQGGKQYDPISGEEIVLTQKKQKNVGEMIGPNILQKATILIRWREYMKKEKTWHL